MSVCHWRHCITAERIPSKALRPSLYSKYNLVSLILIRLIINYISKPVITVLDCVLSRIHTSERHTRSAYDCTFVYFPSWRLTTEGEFRGSGRKRGAEGMEYKKWIENCARNNFNVQLIWTNNAALTYASRTVFYRLRALLPLPSCSL